MNFLKLAIIATLFVAAPTWAESLTGPQNNAVRSAKAYLSMQGFSRDGLIHQLSSDSGDGYEVVDATVAVDSLNINWNKEAVRSAKAYLSMQGFSCKGLIHQLSSSAGAGYTVSQATYGARQAGACQKTPIQDQVQRDNCNLLLFSNQSISLSTLCNRIKRTCYRETHTS